MAYLIKCIDRKNSLDLRLKTRQEHINYLKKNNKLILAGPILDKDQNPKGTIAILDYDQKSEVDLFIRNDPYNKVDLFEKIEITFFKKVL